MNETPRKTLVGWSDIDTCECCGRRDLERTMMVLSDDGTVNYYGSQCGAKVLGRQGTRTQIERMVARAQELHDRFRARHWASIDIVRAERGGRTEDAQRRRTQLEAEYRQWVKDGCQPEQIVTVYARRPFQRASA